MKNLFVFLFSFVIISAQAQQKKVVDKGADKLLNTISKRYKNFKTMKADFIYGIESKADKIQEKQKGTLLVKGNKFKLDIAGQLIICDNQTLWTYSKEVNEVQVNTYNPKESAIRLDDIFTMYGKGFLYKIADEMKEGSREIAVVELTPKDKKRSFHKIKLTIDKTNQTILKSVVYDKNGTIHTYTITNQFPNIKLEDKAFVFDATKYPKVEVIDLR
ncbi:MAG: outer membrane lipoprotein carrier protein LolA [Bacteroidota bacterium]